VSTTNTLIEDFLGVPCKSIHREYSLRYLCAVFVVTVGHQDDFET